MWRFAFACVLLTLSSTLIAQRQTFEVATIKPAKVLAPKGALGIQVSPGQMHAAFLSLKDYIATAYDVEIQQVVSGPPWIDTERFDITAKLPSGATQADMPAMLRNLLSERCHLTTHRDTRDLPVYALEVASGGLKIPKVPNDSSDTSPVTTTAGGNGASAGADLGHGASLSVANNRIEAKKVRFSELTGVLTRFTGRPVVDLTKVDGRFDFTLDLTREDYVGMMVRAALSTGISLSAEDLRALDKSSLDSLIDALKKIGLDFRGRIAPLEVIVIDRVERPTEN